MQPFYKPAVKIDQGGIEARVVLVPVPKQHPETGFRRPSLAEIESVLREEGVNAPLDKEALAEGLTQVVAGLRVEVVAARGLAPEPGKDGWMELLVDLSGPIPPAQSGGGAVDLKSSSLIRNVKAGQPLALVHAPAAGKPGLDVRGKVLPSRPGKNFEPRLGAHIGRAAHDPHLLVAGTDGHLRLKDDRLEIEECFLVAGDVDYASGNITFAKSVLVQGDVKAGFSVDSGGDVEVQGLVEDCQLRARGGIFVRGGFTGTGKGQLEAKGAITLAHVRNQSLRCEGDATVAREAVNSRIQSRARVVVEGLLAGGRTQALLSVACQVAGTETGAPTLIEAGYDYAVAEEMAALRSELADMGRYAKKLDEGLRQLHDMEKAGRGLERWAVELVFEMERMKEKVDAKIASLRKDFSALEDKAVEPRDAVITVRRRAFPGTVIKIGHEVYRVEEPLEGPKSFRSRQGLIEVRGEAAA